MENFHSVKLLKEGRHATRSASFTQAIGSWGWVGDCMDVIKSPKLVFFMSAKGGFSKIGPYVLQAKQAECCIWLQESWHSGSSTQNCVLFPSQPKLEQEKYLVSTWPLKYKWVCSSSLVNVTVCFVLLLPNVVALLSQVTHFQAFASSDALTRGRGEESHCALCWVLQGCFPTEKLHWPWANLKPSAQALCSHESPAAASCSSVVWLGGMVYERALCNSLPDSLGFLYVL